MLQANVVNNIVQTIVDHQKAIIGPLALEQARKVHGVKMVDENKIEVNIKNNAPESLLTQLVQQYEALFGLASVEVCKDAIRELKPTVSPNELPQILR